MNLWTALRKEIMEQWRTSRLLVLVIVLTVFGMLSPVLAKYMPQLLALIPGADQFAGLVPQPTILDAITQYVKNLGQFGLLLALLLTMGAVANEREKGSAALMLVKPLPRVTFILAKFLALALSFSVAVLISALGAYYYTLVLFGALDFGAWLALNGLMLLQMLVYVAITLLFSTLMRSQAAAAGMGIGVLLVMSLLESIPAVGNVLPGRLVAWGASLFTPAPLTGWTALAVSLGLVAVCLAAACLSFQRQEL